MENCFDLYRLSQDLKVFTMSIYVASFFCCEFTPLFGHFAIAGILAK